jgi:hypothetical protein
LNSIRIREPLKFVLPLAGIVEIIAGGVRFTGPPGGGIRLAQSIDVQAMTAIPTK